MRGWLSQRSSAPLYPRSVTASLGEQDEGGPTEEDFGEAMPAREKLSRAFFAPAGKSFHLQAKAGPHEVLNSSRVYLIGCQKGTVQDKQTNI